MERKSGQIVSFSDDNSGRVSDGAAPGVEFDFEHYGARPTFVEGDNVTYLVVKTGDGVKAVNLGRPF
jgi:hypothetical protein